MTTEDFDYTAAAVRVLRASGGPMREAEFWANLMRAENGIPEDDLDLYFTGPFEPGPYPRNMVKFKIGTSIRTDMGLDHVTDREIQAYGVDVDGGGMGYWLREWGPLPEAEQRRRRELRERNSATSTAGSSRSPGSVEADPVRKEGGCYIATAVYGSYEAPEVRVLRRFRDERLSRSGAGRGLVRGYYAFGPHLATHFGSGSSLSRLARPILDLIVRRLSRTM